jgi:hypothetical protein
MTRFTIGPVILGVLWQTNLATRMQFHCSGHRVPPSKYIALQELTETLRESRNAIAPESGYHLATEQLSAANRQQIDYE